jgi:hypothetical protein
MTKHEFVAGDVWETLRDLARHSGGRKWVASAYLGTGASDEIGLGQGDVLLVALSERNAKNGSVSPHEISRLCDLGVEVFVEEYLHAKVYLMGDVLAVGSPNLSSNSISSLNEALLITRDRAAVRAARLWFKATCTTPVTPKWLEKCKQFYKPPRRGPGASTRKDSPGRLWLVGMRKIDFPEDERKQWEVGEAEAEQQRRDEYVVEPLRFTGTSRFFREVKRGDLIIQVWRKGGRKMVYPHARVLATRKTTSRRGAKVVYVYVETPEEPTVIGWTEFKRKMGQVGLRLGREVGCREINGPRAMMQAKTLTFHHVED